MMWGRCLSSQDVVNVREGSWRKGLQLQGWNYLREIENANERNISLDMLFDPVVHMNPLVNYLDVNWGWLVPCRGSNRLSILGLLRRLSRR